MKPKLTVTQDELEDHYNGWLESLSPGMSACYGGHPDNKPTPREQRRRQRAGRRQRCYACEQYELPWWRRIL